MPTFTGPVTVRADPGGAFVVGTMLPFNRLRNSSRNFLYNMPYSPSGDANPPSNNTWELGDDGRVMMTEVWLVASSNWEFYPTELTQDQRAWKISGPDTDEPRRLVARERVCLHEYLQRQLVPSLTGQARHAVLTINTPDINFAAGIILMQVYDDEEPVRTFTKVADFNLDNKTPGGPDRASFSQSEIVRKFIDWEVL